MSINVVSLRPRPVMHVSTLGSYAASVPRAWDALFALLDRFGLEHGAGNDVGLAYDDPDRTAPHACRYAACLSLPAVGVPKALPGLPIKTVPGGIYVRARRVGPAHSFNDALRSVQQGWLANNGLAIDWTRPIIAVFLDSLRATRDRDLRSDLYIPASSGISRQPR